MIRRPIFLWFLMIVFMGILLQIGTRQSIQELEASSATPGPPPAPEPIEARWDVAANEVLVAARDLDPAVRSQLTTEDVRVTRMPDAIFVPAEAIRKTQDLVGKQLVSRIYEGEVLVENRFAERDSGRTKALTDYIDKDQRAIALQVDAVSGTVGFLGQGDRVDVIALYDLAGQVFSRIILENVVVLARGNEHREQPAVAAQPRISGEAGTVTVTLQVDALMALRLAHLAGGVHRYCLILRNPDDDEPAGTRGVLLREILDGVSRRASRPELEQGPSVEVLRGSDLGELVQDQSVDPVPRAEPYDPMDPHGIERALAAQEAREAALEAARPSDAPRPLAIKSPGEFYGVYEDPENPAE